MRLSYKFFYILPSSLCSQNYTGLIKWVDRYFLPVFRRYFAVSWYPTCWWTSAASPNIILSSWNLLRFSLCLCCCCISQNVVEVYIFYFLRRNWYVPSNCGLVMPSIWNVLSHYSFTYSSLLISPLPPSRISTRVSVNVRLPLSSPCLSTSLSYLSFFPSLRAVLWIISPDLSSKPLIFFSALSSLLLTHPLSFSFLLSFSRKSS